MRDFNPTLMRDECGHFLLVFAQGRKLFHAVKADNVFRVVSLDTLRGLRPVPHKGGDYPVRRAASFWLNKSVRECTGGAKKVLRGLVKRK